MARFLVLHGGNVADGPYGIDLLWKDLGHEVIYPSSVSNKYHKKFRDVLEHRLGYPIDKTLRSFAKAKKSDAIFCFLEREAIFPSILKQKNIKPFSDKPLVMISCWLAEEIKNMSVSEKRRIVKLYSGVDLNLVFSSNQIDILVEAGFPKNKVASVPFGFARETFTLVNKDFTQKCITAVGVDRGRDYATLFDAVQGLDIELDLYTRPEIIAELEIPENVNFHGQVPFEEYVDVLHHSSIVAIPTYELAYPTGQTVALEAAATGSALLLTDSVAMRDYFSDEDVYYFSEGDSTELRRKILQVLNEPGKASEAAQATAKKVREKFVYNNMWKSIEDTLTLHKLL